MRTVALVEDDADTRELLTIAIGKCKEFKLVGAFGTGEAALRDLPRCKPDVVLMDLKLPGMSGIECTCALRNLIPPPKSRILILTEYEDSELIFDAVCAGADGYLSKRHLSARELKAAIRQVFAGGTPLSPAVARKVIEFLRVSLPVDPARTKQRSESPTSLSPREEEVFDLRNQGLMYKEIASRLDISIDTVRKHLQSVQQKVRVRSRSAAILHGMPPGRGNHHYP